VNISQNFDAGNIEVVVCDNPDDIQLKIRSDNQSEFYQWFYFRLSGAKHKPCTLKLLNAAGAAYPGGFENYRVLYSYDRIEWRRHPASLREGVLSIQFEPQYDAVYFAYFTPYSMERHADLVAASLQSPLCSLRVVGQTIDGQDMDLLQITSGSDHAEKKNCWIIARQHPGESMSEWWMEGCIERLLDENNPASKILLEKCNLFLVPNMNPDGSRRGHLRTNAVGRNLNREWADADLKNSPEVFHVKKAMQETGVDFLLDVHGDESLPYCFIAGTEGLSNWNSDKQAQLDFYKRSLQELNVDFQTEQGYPAKQPGQANLTMSTSQIAHLHDCLAITLEMPFKDTTATPDEKYGWSAARSKMLAHSCLDALSAYLSSELI
jgi:murein tripeptide amidase MpaA